MSPKSPEPPVATDGRPGVRRRVLAARLMLLVLALGALLVGWAIALRDGPDGGARYVCPMHPEVVSKEPSTCPICGMALEPKDAKEAMQHGPGSMNDDVEAVENVRKHNVIDFVRRRSLLPHSREMRGQAWLEEDGTISAVFYKDQVDVMVADDPGTFSLARSPGVTIAVRRMPDPPEAWDDSTARVRFRPEKSSAVHAGDVGWVELARRPRDVLAVPASAILQSPEGPYVLAWTGIGYQFEKRPIQIAETFTKYGYAVVLSGLRANERVVSRAAFFLDAERRLASRAAEGGSANP